MNNSIEARPPCLEVPIERKVVISQNYERLICKPKINGIELTGDMSSDDLSILSNDLSKYEVLSVLPPDGYVLITTENGETGKFRLKDATTGRITGEDLSSCEVGDFIIKHMED